MGTYSLGSPEDDYYGQGDWRCDPVEVTDNTWRYWELSDNDVAAFNQAKSIYDMALQNLSDQYDRMYNDGFRSNPNYDKTKNPNFPLNNMLEKLYAPMLTRMYQEVSLLSSIEPDLGTRDDTVGTNERIGD